MVNQVTVNQSSPEIINVDESLLDYSDIWRALLQSWRLIGGLTLIFALLALIFALLLPKQWEAIATLRIGHVQLDTGELKLIEDPSETVARIKLIGFKEKILMDLALPTEKGVNKHSDLIISSLKADSILNTDFVNLSIRGYSREEAQKALGAAIKAIKITHELLTNPQKTRITKELEATTANFETTSSELSALKSQIDAAGIYKTSSTFAPSIVATNLLAEKERNKQALQNQLIQYNARLAAFDEQATKTVNSINVSKRPVFPKRSVFLVAGALLGLLIGTLIAVLKYRKPID